jgi:hypothetical protein
VVLEVASFERALEIAARYPDAQTGALEIREVIELPGLQV